MFGEIGLTPAAVQPPPPALQVMEGAVHLAPVVARFEMAAITGRGLITDFRVCGIFIDRYYRQARRDGARPAGAARIQVADNAFVPGTGDFVTIASHTTTHQNPVMAGGATTTVSGGTLFTSYSPALIAENDVVTGFPTARPFGTTNEGCQGVPAECSHTHTSPLRNTWSYQVFARHYGDTPPAPTTTQPPRIIVRVTDVFIRDAYNAIIPKPGGNVWYLTVTDFRRTDNNLLLSATGIRASNVYTIVQLSFTEQDLTPRPNMNPFNATVEVTLGAWQGEDIGQGRFLQPNPIGADLSHLGHAPPTGHPFAGFPLGEATHEACSENIRYVWQRSYDNINWTPAIDLNNPAAIAAVATEAQRTLLNLHLTQTTYFRRIAFACNEHIITTHARVVVIPPVMGYVSTFVNVMYDFQRQLFYTFTPAAVAAPTHFQWQVATARNATDANWHNITSAGASGGAGAFSTVSAPATHRYATWHVPADFIHNAAAHGLPADLFTNVNEVFFRVVFRVNGVYRTQPVNERLGGYPDEVCALLGDTPHPLPPLRKRGGVEWGTDKKSLRSLQSLKSPKVFFDILNFTEKIDN